MGAKIAALTRNHAGIVYDSWRDDVGSRIRIAYDTVDRCYGIVPIKSTDEDVQWFATLDDSAKPSVIESHGTRVTLLGMSENEDTMLPPAEAKGGRENWLYQYLNTRFFVVPDEVDLQVRVGYYRPKDNVRHNYTRKVAGQRATLNNYAVSHGTVSLSDAKIWWWILKSDRSGHGREYVVGHTGCINQNELFDLADGRSNRAAGFGVIFGKEDVVLYVEPSSGYVQDTTRTRLVQTDGSALPWDRWQDEFREKMPPEIQQFMKDKMGASEKDSHSESIRERLRTISQFFRLSRYKKNPAGQFEVDPSSETKGKVGSGTEASKEKGGGFREGKAGDYSGALDALLLSGIKSEGERASEVSPDKFPEVKWVSSSNGNRADEYLGHVDKLLTQRRAATI